MQRQYSQIYAKARAVEKAGGPFKDGKLQKDGVVFTIEFLLVQPAFERIVAPYIKNLAKLGIEAKCGPLTRRNIKTASPIMILTQW